MGWLQSLFSPFKKLFLRLHSPRNNKSSRGIYILYEDVKSCQYEDVHVLWSILVESHKSPTLLLPPPPSPPPPPPPPPNSSNNNNNIDDDIIMPFTQSKLLCPPPQQVNERG